MAQLASRFGRNVSSLVSHVPLSDDQMRAVAPSIFAEEAHSSRSERYGYVPTIEVLKGLRQEGFQPFMVGQTVSRKEDRREFTKHMIRLRHADQKGADGANEVILVNSHDGSSSYQMLAGFFRFVCMNGMVCGDVVEDVRVPHNKNAVQRVVEGAHQVLDGFGLITEKKEGMQSIQLSKPEQLLFAEAAVALKYDEEAAAPIRPSQILVPRRFEDARNDLWTTFNRVQENLVRGGIPGRSASGRNISTRAVQGIDQNVKLNRALWQLAEGMKQLKVAEPA